MAQTVSAALARKLSMGQDDLGDRPRSVLRALRLSIARAASDCLNLPLTVIGAKQSNRPPDDLTKAIGQDWLLLLFVGSGDVAAVCLDPNTVSAIVQTQTIGEVTADPPAPRAFTDTDAAMTAPLVEDTLVRADALAEGAADQACLAGYEFTSRAGDLRSMSLALLEDSYRVFDLTVELAGGMRQGQVMLLLPDLPASADMDAAAQDTTGPRMEHSSGVLRAELNAVLCRMTLPLTGLSELAVGDVLPLIGARLDKTEILTIERARAAVGRLGQSTGLRAIRLNERPPLPALDDTGEPEFIDSTSQLSRQGDSEPPIPDVRDVTPNDPVDNLQEAEALTGEFSLAGSDLTATDISQLAGLLEPDDQTGPAD